MIGFIIFLIIFWIVLPISLLLGLYYIFRNRKEKKLVVAICLLLFIAYAFYLTKVWATFIHLR